MKLLKVEHPGWIMLGCTAHALNLLIKDLASSKRGACAWLTKVYDTAVMMSNRMRSCFSCSHMISKAQTFAMPCQCECAQFSSAIQISIASDVDSITHMWHECNSPKHVSAVMLQLRACVSRA